MKIGIIKEGKVPPDSRVPLTPEQCLYLTDKFDLDITVEPFAGRCYPDREYRDAGIRLSRDLSGCDFLMGVKEVPVEQLIPEKTYFFFSHTIKKQPHNRQLLRAILERHIRLIDYEVLTDDHGRRVIAFGRFAGMVGAHNALWTYGQRTGAFALKRMKDCHDYAEAKALYQPLQWPPVRIVLTGTGRVGSGAADVLRDMNIRQVPPQDFLRQDYEEAVFTQLRVHHYIARQDEQPFATRDYYENPTGYKSTFYNFYRRADIMINGIYWDRRAPAFFSKAEMRQPDFRIQVIADVTCDIAPESSIPSTLRPSTIDDPVYGYDPVAEEETAPFQENAIDIMAIDNLPNELPRDASNAFGEQFIEHVLPELFKEESPMIERATVAEKGKLTPAFIYLEDYVLGEH